MFSLHIIYIFLLQLNAAVFYYYISITIVQAIPEKYHKLVTICIVTNAQHK